MKNVNWVCLPVPRRRIRSGTLNYKHKDQRRFNDTLFILFIPLSSYCHPLSPPGSQTPRATNFSNQWLCPSCPHRRSPTAPPFTTLRWCPIQQASRPDNRLRVLKEICWILYPFGGIDLVSYFEMYIYIKINILLLL